MIKVVSKTIKNEAKEQKGGIFSVLLGTSGASLLENLLTSIDTIRTSKGTIKPGQGF